MDGSPLLAAVLRVVALILFVAASITDYWDGKLARIHGWITPFGQLMDPLADKVLVMAAFVCFVHLKIFPSWMVVLILAREFMITGLRQLASAQGLILSADRWGKNKTISQMTVIITALTFYAAQGWLEYFGLWNADVMRRWEVSAILKGILHIMMWITVLLTVISGWRYCAINYRLFRDS
jgi:CDP-diacylglycerol--glycerol-3-phosphate 3-phosphatidyltransferase